MTHPINPHCLLYTFSIHKTCYYAEQLFTNDTGCHLKEDAHL